MKIEMAHIFFVKFCIIKFICWFIRTRVVSDLSTDGRIDLAGVPRGCEAPKKVEMCITTTYMYFTYIFFGDFA
jgi:hypothetical protein